MKIDTIYVEITNRCNLNCATCYNRSGMNRETVEIAPETLEMLIETCRPYGLRRLLFSGGEPTLQPDLEDFIRRVRALGYAVKLDTNGYRPEVLERLISEGLVDYIAMDIKSSREGYSRLAGVPVDIDKIEQSVRIIMHSGVPYEFRTTVIGDLHTEEDFHKMADWLAGAEKFFLQGFVDSGDVISGDIHGYDKSGMNNLLNVMKMKIPSAKIRG